jgi:23S rRNA-/tRNA-specific pseudouridylate synthase
MSLELRKNEDFKLVHRLDRDTTGILVVATSASAAQRLNKLFRESKVMKTVSQFIFS